MVRQVMNGHFARYVGRMVKLPLLVSAGLMLSGCAEVEYGSHLVKRAQNYIFGSSAPTEAPTAHELLRYVPAAQTQLADGGIAVMNPALGHGLSAAHPTAPIGSQIQVTNRSTGQVATLTVVRRLDGQAGRAIEVSPEAAQILGMAEDGQAVVALGDTNSLATTLARADSDQLAVSSLPGLPAGAKIEELPLNAPITTTALDPVIEVENTRTQPGYQGIYGNGAVYTGPLDGVQIETGATAAPSGTGAQSSYDNALYGQGGKVIGSSVIQPGGHVAPQSAPVMRYQTPAQQHAATQSKGPAGGGRFVQLGSFSDPGNAHRLVARLQAEGHRNAFAEPVQLGNRTVHRVRIGPLMAQEEAATLRMAQSMGHNDAKIVSR